MRNNKKSSGCGRIFLVTLLILVIAGLGGGLYAKNWYDNAVYAPVSEAEGTTIIEIKDGKGLLEIADSLVEQGLLSDKNALRIYLELENPTINIVAGNYQIPNDTNVPELIETLNAGPVISTATVTLREGLRHDEFAEALEKGFAELETASYSKTEYIQITEDPSSVTFATEVQEFLDKYKPADANLEGYLFPDTYTFANDATAQNVIELQIRTLIKRLDENNVSPDTQSRVGGFHEVINLASLLEREAGVGENLLIVSDIFLKRIENNIPLSADASYLYPLKDWNYRLTSTELRNNYDNKYNTYLYGGLMPTPISNPGIEAIDAVYNPKENPYFYFITGTDGNNYYARTIGEHQQNINRYL